MSNSIDRAAQGRAETAQPAWLHALAVAVALFAALPLLVSIPAPLQDWPGHLARVHILDELLRGAGPWSRFYDFNGFLLPNVALDVGVLGLVRAGLPLGLAGMLFLLAVYGLFVTGFTRMAEAFSARSPATPILGAIFFYNTALFWGFVNFEAALGLSFWIVAWWIQARPAPAKLLLAVLGAAATVACHIVPAVILVGVLGLLDLTGLARHWRQGVARHCTSLAAAATVVVLLLLSPTGADGFAMGYVGSGSPQAFLYWKAQAYIKALLSGSIWPDAITTGLGATIIGVVAGLLVWKAARLSAKHGGLAVLAALLLLPLLAPQRLGAGSLLDYRLAVLPFVFAAATLRVRFAGPRGAAAVFALLTILVLLRTATLGVAWRQDGRFYSQADTAFATLPPGSLLLAGSGRRVQDISWTEWWSPPIAHIDALAVPYGLIVPTTFALASQQPLVLKPALLPWSLVRDISTPARLDETLTEARLLCGTGQPVSMAVLYPTSFMTGPAFHPVNRRLSIIDACAP